MTMTLTLTVTFITLMVTVTLTFDRELETLTDPEMVTLRVTLLGGGRWDCVRHYREGDTCREGPLVAAVEACEDVKLNRTKTFGAHRVPGSHANFRSVSYIRR